MCVCVCYIRRPILRSSVLDVNLRMFNAQCSCYYVYIYIYVYIHIYVYVYIYIYIYIYIGEFDCYMFYVVDLVWIVSIVSSKLQWGRDDVRAL